MPSIDGRRNRTYCQGEAPSAFLLALEATTKSLVPIQSRRGGKSSRESQGTDLLFEVLLTLLFLFFTDSSQ
jgi:hypothetical protein